MNPELGHVCFARTYSPALAATGQVDTFCDSLAIMVVYLSV